LLAEGKISGLRIDHPDGLWDPPAYFCQLQMNLLLRKLRNELGLSEKNAPGHFPASVEQLQEAVAQWCDGEVARSPGCRRWPLYVVVEKILTQGESLPESWAVHGTTGYDFLAQVNGLFVDSENQKAFHKIYNQFTGDHVKFDNLVNSSKKMIMLVSMAGEINALAHQIDRISEKNRWYRDFTLNSLTFTIREVIASLQVYRTYLNGKDKPSKRDEKYIVAAVEEAMKRNPRTARALFEFIRDTLLLRSVEDFREEDRSKLSDFTMTFQQITGPVMAKGVEDTAFYIYNRLVSLNEVGSDPQEFGISLETFHQKATERQQHWPYSLLTTSTHDTKRSEDVRARINVLSEIPLEWKPALTRWSRLNAYHKSRIDGKPAPDRNEEYLFYQILLGAWPDGPMTPEDFEAFRERIAAYMLKAIREAKVHTSWVNPNEAYEAAVQGFVRAAMEEGSKNLFLKDLPNLQQRVSFYGRFNALAQLLLKMTSPGVPDFYQGTELWNYSLVDPDNRRPVDYEHTRTHLTELKKRIAQGDLAALASDLLDLCHDGRIKLYLTYRTLNFRREHSDLFSSGDYTPLEVSGEKKDCVCTFARSLGTETILVFVPRLIVRLTGRTEQVPLGPNIWQDTRIILPTHLPPHKYRNLFTGELVATDALRHALTLRLADVFQRFPVALLERIPEPETT
jgi:(1->4)-alpha-D-glucan 1-alpha-D-glucosylmutase